MTRKLILGFSLVAFLLLTNMALAGERPSNGPVTVPTKCDCLKKDIAPVTEGVISDILYLNPNNAPVHPPNCMWVCHHYDYCYLYIPGIGCVYWVSDWECNYECHDNYGNPL